jgi:hypothetical protein
MWPGTDILAQKNTNDCGMWKNPIAVKNILALIFEHPTHGPNSYKDTKP